MAWNTIANLPNWEYSDTPDIDDPINAHNYAKMNNLVAGIRTNTDNTEVYVYCRKTDRVDGVGYGELNKTALEG